MTSNKQQIATLHDAAQKAMAEGKLRAVHEHCLAILQIDSTFADAWFLCGVIAAHNGLLSKSVGILEQATALAPENPEYRAELGKQLLADQQPERALQEAKKTLRLSPSQPPTINTLGSLLSHVGEHEEALGCFEHAVRLLQQRPEGDTSLSKKWQADLYFNYAASLQFAGCFKEAATAYEQAISILPSLFKAHSALSTLRQQTEANNHLNRLNALREQVVSSRDQLHIGHAIAKEQEDLGRFEEAFDSLVWAKQAQARAVKYSREKNNQLFTGVRDLFSAGVFTSAKKGHDTDEPIFIVGMPRTGTTLTEQVLSSHSQVFAAGELPLFPLQVKRSVASTANDLFDLETFAASLATNTADLGAHYIESTRPRTGHTARFTDKLPLNFLFLGLIGQALPKAKIICLRRDPMDTCLSNYRQIFAANFRHYQYNLNLLDCGQYYIQFDRTMRHWHQMMPGRIFDLRYESLVENPTAVVRALLNYCELPWEEQCLSFHGKEGSVATPSAVQVRQSIYATSVDRWQRYGEQLKPLYDLLQSAGVYRS
ncbi:MAG: sulfotransferase [Halieaceae bacterium]|nr:sulfotransferase [Halieaceae bacterium]